MHENVHVIRRIDGGPKLSTGSAGPRVVELARVSDLDAGLKWVNDTFGDGVVDIETDPMHPACADACVMQDGDMLILSIEPEGFTPGT